ncbi:cell division protein ZapA, partial [Paenibacillus sepulcri]|nr:cell division protein ZapA [Paenibacillus sepulcri]
MDAAERARVTVDIYGNQFKFTGHTNPEYIKRIAALVDENMHKLAKGYPRLDLPKIAVLVAVHMAEDVFRLSRENERMQEIEAR